MKAWVLHDIGDLRLEDAAEPVPAPNEVLVKVKAAGICGSDVPRIYRTGAHTHPLIPGHEFSGIVVETGKEADTKWRGKRVGICPLIPCGECLPCRNSQYELCRRYSYLGSRRNGGFAEYAAVPAENLVELPGEVSFEEAAMLEPMAVAVHAMRRSSPAESEWVAVCGLGTIGLLLVLFLRDAGVRNMLAVGNKELQKKALIKMGIAAENYVDSREGDTGKRLMEATKGIGADVLFECVGKNETVVEALESAAPCGRVCLVGNPDTDMKLERLLYWKILRNQLTVTGTWNSRLTHKRTDDWQYVLERVREKRIAPSELITHRISLEELGEGIRMMRDKTEDYIKIMVEVR